MLDAVNMRARLTVLMRGKIGHIIDSSMPALVMMAARLLRYPRVLGDNNVKQREQR